MKISLKNEDEIDIFRQMKTEIIYSLEMYTKENSKGDTSAKYNDPI